MAIINTRIKTFESTNLSEVENNINKFSEELQAKVLKIDIKPYEIGNSIYYLGIVTYLISSLFTLDDVIRGSSD